MSDMSFRKTKLMLLFLSITYGQSLDCPNVINLAFGLGMNLTNPSIWTSLQSNCCSTSGITCNGGRVTQIAWISIGLNGTINGTALPSGLHDLELYQNKLNGTIPQNLPIGLQILSLDTNQFTGTIPQNLPNGLQSLYLETNQLTGSIPENLPGGLEALDLTTNQLTGSIPETWPSGLTQLYLCDNLLSGDVSSLPSRLQFLYLSLSSDSKFNHFTGSIRLSAPHQLFIFGNWITDVVVIDRSQLQYCDLSYNPLLGNPDIVNLTMCAQTGLYAASLLPNTATYASSSQMTTTIRNGTPYITFEQETLANSYTSSVVQTGIAKSSGSSIVISTAKHSSNGQNVGITRQGRFKPTSQSYIMSNSIATVPGATPFTSIVVVSFTSHHILYTITPSLYIRILISVFLLSYFVAKTPFKREFNKMIKNAKNDKNQSDISKDLDV